MTEVKYAKACLVAFLASSFLYTAVPLPEDLPLGRQLFILFGLQLGTMISACFFVWMKARPADFLFDLRPTRRRRGQLRLVHSDRPNLSTNGSE